MLPVATVHIVSAMTELVADYDYGVILLILQSRSTNHYSPQVSWLTNE